ncbi:MAG: PD-(D/E)XK nuclease family protein [Candidatus Shikimatogenerans bostrichidophilus]|nr:MAG: PD-(D/E)XK nuclease family protein [Candidatus Shikimatogenerans bostrichidophilus]
MIINKITKILKEYINSKTKKYYFILPNKYYLFIIKKIYITILKKKYGIIPNIFFTKIEFMEKITKFKIVKNHFYLLKILYKIFIEIKIKKNNNINFKELLYLLEDFNIIDKNLVNLKEEIININNYYTISKWFPNVNVNNKNKNNLKLIYLLYKKYKKTLIKSKLGYYGLILKQVIKKIKFYFKKKKKYHFFFLGKIFINKCEKKIKKKILLIKNNKINFINFKINSKPKKKNKIKIINTNNLIYKYIIIKNIIIKNLKNKENTTIIFTNELYDNLLFKFFNKRLIKNINFNIKISISNMILHNFIELLFKLLKFKITFIEYKILYLLLNNYFINFLIKNNKINKILLFLNKNNLNQKFININNKYFKRTFLFILLKKKHKFLYYLKKIILYFLYKIKLNKFELIYLNKLLKFIIYIKSNKLFNNTKNLFVLFKYYILKNEFINITNFNVKSLIEIVHINFLIKESIINYLDNIIIILNKNYNYNIDIIKSYFLKKIKLKNNKCYNYYINKFKNISNKFYLINNKFNNRNKKLYLNLKYYKKTTINNIKIINNLKINHDDLVKLNINFKKKIFYYLNRKGFNFTSIKFYIKNPINFFLKFILKIDFFENNEAKIFGNIIHKILFILYKKYINLPLKLKYLNKIKNNIKTNKLIKFICYKYYKRYNIDKMIIDYNFKIIKKFILKFINNDIKLILEGNIIKIINLEKYYKVKIYNKIILTGKIDRIEYYNGLFRIVDYKSYFNIKYKNLLIFKEIKDIRSFLNKDVNNNIFQMLLYLLIFSCKKKYKYIYSSIYYPDKIKNIKINNNIKINYNFILYFKKKIYNFLLNLLKNKLVCDLSNI